MPIALPQPSIAQLRPALKLAFDTAASAPPGHALPGRVRSLVRSRRLPPTWAVTMVQVLDDDHAFRSWVAETAPASEEALGRVAWLWLTRPEGWADEVAGLVEAEAATEEMDKEVRLASERADALERELTAVREKLARARADQSALAAEAEERRRAAARLEADRRAELSSALADREERVADLEAAGAALEQERRALTAQVQDLESRLARSERARLDAEEAGARLGRELDSMAQERDAVRDESEARRTSVAGAVERAGAAASELGRALAHAAAALNPDRRGPTGRQETERGSHHPGPEPVAARRPRRPVTRAPARRPVDLPLGVFEDSREAAAYLVRVPGVHLVVDGYNVALTSWAPGGPVVADLPALRRRLLDALGELAVRVQRNVTVVFDGREEGGRTTAAGPARPWLRIVFSASSVEADEVILEAVRELRPEVPVVVATNDREVRDGAERLGANVISVRQLLGVLNRHTSM